MVLSSFSMSASNSAIDRRLPVFTIYFSSTRLVSSLVLLASVCRHSSRQSHTAPSAASLKS